MHYYKRNIGDYAKKAGRLSMLEHGAYTLLIDACYDRERFPTKEEAIEWCWARTPEEIAAVDFVLSRFFTLEDGTYTQERIADELAKYHENAARNSKIATEREAKRTERTRNVHTPSQSVQEWSPNQEPLTTNNKPRTTRNTVAALPPDGVSDSTWQSFQQLRKAKRAPITPAAIAGLRQEADKAGWTMEDALKECCTRGWQGFKADWVAVKVPIAQVTVPSSNEPDPALAKLERDAQIPKGIPAELKDTIAKLTGRVNPNTKTSQNV